MRRLPTAVIAGSSLVVGFAAARVTGLPFAGAAVVLAGAAWCVAREVRRTAWWRLLVVVLVGAACFVLSHLLAGVLGAWASVAVVSVALGVVTYLLVDRAGARLSTSRAT